MRTITRMRAEFVLAMVVMILPFPFIAIGIAYYVYLVMYLLSILPGLR